MLDLGSLYKSGVPELGLPSLDPLTMPEIKMQLGNAEIKFTDILMEGYYWRGYSLIVYILADFMASSDASASWSFMTLYSFHFLLVFMVS